MKVLNADDKHENLYMLEALLRGHGHEVDSASNGLDALRLAERGHYDVIVSDILMPRMDGFQFCREVKKDTRLRHVPFIFYTATYTDPKDAAFALSLGADRFLVKPVEPEIFLKTIEEVVATFPRMDRAAEADGAGEDEAIYLKEYNARLIVKLEKKMLDLDRANRALRADIIERERAEQDRAKLEDQLRQSQKMEAIGTLAGGIAHDFNNILAGIVGFAELAQQEIRRGGSVEHHLEVILGAGQRARDLVQQILAFSRHREQSRRPMRLSGVVEDALRLLRATIPTSIGFFTSLDTNAPTVLADETQVHQVLTNLVTNASHAIGDQPGRIEIALHAFNVDADFARTHPDLREGPYVRVSVSDTGAGMDAAIVERIFEPFFTTKETGRGTGLGLSVVHGIMKACDGAITVYSQAGKGTTFHLYYPALEIESATSPGSAPTLPIGHGERVLFIDDEAVLTTLGERFLTRLGYQPVTTTDPLRALELFRAEPFDLVVTDLTMPQFNGVDLGRQLLELRPGVPIILTTGYSAIVDRDRAREYGFRDLLLKPYTAHSLGEAIQRALA